MAPERLPAKPPAKRRFNWKIPIIFGLAAGLVGYGVAKILPKMYKVNTSLYFPSQGESDATSLISEFMGKGKGLSALSGGSVGAGGGSSEGAQGGDSGTVSLLGGLLEQPEVASGAQTAIAVLDSTRCREAVNSDLNLQQKWKLRKKTDVLLRLQGEVTYGLDKNGLLAIEVDDHDKYLAYAIAQSYLKNLQDIATLLSTGFSHNNREFLDHELMDARDRLLRQESLVVAEQSKKNRPPVSSAAGDTIASAFIELEEKELEAKVTLDGADNSISTVTQLANSAINNNANLPEEVPLAMAQRAQLRDSEARFEYAKATEGPDNPDYNSAKLQLATAQGQLQAEISREEVALKQRVSPDLAQLYATRAGLQAEYLGLVDARKRMQNLIQGTLPTTEMRETQLTDDAKIDGDTVGLLASEDEKARIAEHRDIPTFVVVDIPEIPEDYFFPRAGIIALVSVLAGFLVGCGWIMIRSLPKSQVQLIDASEE